MRLFGDDPPNRGSHGETGRALLDFRFERDTTETGIRRQSRAYSWWEGECSVNRLNRRQFLGGAAATAAPVTLGARSVHAQKRGLTRRLVAHADLRIVHPPRLPNYVTRSHDYLRSDSLCRTG